MKRLKRLGRSPRLLAAAGEILALYLKLCERTSRLVDGSDGFRERVAAESLSPFICVSWHGEHFLSHIVREPREDVRALISRHGDGQINAVAASRLGLGLVRGSGGQGAKIRKRGGAAALRALLTALEDGASIFQTADVPKVGKRVGEGTIALARLSGRPVIPFAVVSRRHVRLDTWDKAAIPLPFSRLVFLPAEPIFVPADADADALEQMRLEVEHRLNDVHKRAYALAKVSSNRLPRSFAAPSTPTAN